MNLLGVDFGLKHVGIALSYGTPLAEPLTTVKFKSMDSLVETLGVLIDKHKVDRVVIGIPEGEIADEGAKLAELLKSGLEIDVVLFNENYSSKQAQFQARQAGKKKGKIKKKEHEWSAGVILQNYLDSNLE